MSLPIIDEEEEKVEEPQEGDVIVCDPNKFVYDDCKPMKYNMITYIFILVKVFSEQFKAKYDLKLKPELNKMLTEKYNLKVDFTNEMDEEDSFELNAVPRSVIIKCFHNNFFNQTAISKVYMNGDLVKDNEVMRNVDESTVKVSNTEEEYKNFLKRRIKLKIMEKQNARKRTPTKADKKK